MPSSSQWKIQTPKLREDDFHVYQLSVFEEAVALKIESL